MLVRFPWNLTLPRQRSLGGGGETKYVPIPFHKLTHHGNARFGGYVYFMSTTLISFAGPFSTQAAIAGGGGGNSEVN
jgi:hypothetical protein